jgi:hypothetical protein
MKESPKKFLLGNFIKKTSGKTKIEMGRRHPEGNITDPSKTRIEKSRKHRRMGVYSEGGQGPEGAVASYMDCNMAYETNYMYSSLDSLLVTLRIILIIKPTRCTISQIYFWKRTLHVSDRFSVHHHESSTVFTATDVMMDRETVRNM